MAPLTKTNISRLLGQLNQTDLTLTNQPLYQVIKELINALDAINVAAGSISSSSTSTVCKCNTPGLLINDGGDNDTPSYIPGPKGDTGATGPAGNSGISGFMVAEDGIDGLECYIQGPKGDIGLTGNSGIPSLMVAEDGVDGLDSFIPGPPGANGSGGSLTWTLITTSTPTGVNHVDFTGLAAYAEIRVLVRLMTYGSGDTTALQVSTDNGATFLSAATDYREILGTGAESGVGNIPFYGATSTTGKSGEILIEGFNLTSPKVSRAVPDTSAVQYMQVLPSVSAFNAVRVLSTGTNNFTGGTIYIWGR